MLLSQNKINLVESIRCYKPLAAELALLAVLTETEII